MANADCFIRLKDENDSLKSEIRTTDGETRILGFKEKIHSILLDIS